MKNILPAATLVALLLGTSSPSMAQYHYEFGNGRVTNQTMNGLYMPTSTYIGAGTLSRSAQGKGAGIGGALPSVNMGSHVRTPGDNMYNNDGSERETNGAFIYSDQRQAMEHMQMEKEYRRMLNQRVRERSQRAVRQDGHFYVPGSNGATTGYDSLRSNSNSSYGSGTGGTRGF